MSTRSGKRIHVLLQEDSSKPDDDIEKSVRKTRSKHTKENVEEPDSNVKPKKRNYVAYPGDHCESAVENKEDGRTTRALRKNALKERNNVSSTECADSDVPKSVRSTRRTRKLAADEDAPDQTTQEEPLLKPNKKKKRKLKREDTEVETVKNIEVKAGSKKKSKQKKARKTNSIIIENIALEAPDTLNTSNMSVDSFHSAAGSPRNTNNDAATTQIVEEATEALQVRKTRSLIRRDSSTKNDFEIHQLKIRKSSLALEKESVGQQVNCDKNEIDHNIQNGVSLNCNNDVNSSMNVEKQITSTRKCKRATFDVTVSTKKVNTTFDNTVEDKKNDETFTPIKDSATEILNTTFEKDVTEVKGRRKSGINTMTQIKSNMTTPNRRSYVSRAAPEITIEDDVVEEITTENKPIAVEHSLTTNKESPLFNNTFEKEAGSEIESETIKNNTFDKSSLKSTNEVFSPIKNNDNKKSLINTTYEKDSDTKTSANTTFDIVNETIDSERQSLHVSQKPDENIDHGKKHDTTFDKESKSSLLISDSSIITLDKSNNSRISLTSDESKNDENILNISPVLIESSLDESAINVDREQTEETPDKMTVSDSVQTTLTGDKNNTTSPKTPLKREGTFTKDEPGVLNSSLNTPTKRTSLPSAGFTPFHVNKSSSKEKGVLLNVTRSVEKRRSSLLDPPRTTKVMFCSPVNNPVVASQIKRKVIKSNLKGSNKSFVFDESTSVEPRGPSRKRSYTHNDAEEARAKRSRLAPDTHSATRLSRPRTSSASAKLAGPSTPSKKALTPSSVGAVLSRTKLPNFAALHQRSFDRMESLTQGQQRRAKRARDLLRPSGGLNVLERGSPKGKPTPDKRVQTNEMEKKPKEKGNKPKEKAEKERKTVEKPKKEDDKEPPKPETPIKSLPTLKSLNPGYTRFGFKLNFDVNPFSIPSKATNKPKETKPNILTRQPSLLSQGGAAGRRRDAARRDVARRDALRETTCAARASEKRTENRTVIKGVRTNRRFELQMKMRDI